MKSRTLLYAILTLLILSSLALAEVNEAFVERHEANYVQYYQYLQDLNQYKQFNFITGIVIGLLIAVNGVLTKFKPAFAKDAAFYLALAIAVVSLGQDSSLDSTMENFSPLQKSLADQLTVYRQQQDQLFSPSSALEESVELALSDALDMRSQQISTLINQIQYDSRLANDRLWNLLFLSNDPNRDMDLISGTSSPSRGSSFASASSLFAFFIREASAQERLDTLGVLLDGPNLFISGTSGSGIVIDPEAGARSDALQKLHTLLRHSATQHYSQALPDTVMTTLLQLCDRNLQQVDLTAGRNPGEITVRYIFNLNNFASIESIIHRRLPASQAYNIREMGRVIYRQLDEAGLKRR